MADDNDHPGRGSPDNNPGHGRPDHPGNGPPDGVPPGPPSPPAPPPRKVG